MNATPRRRRAALLGLVVAVSLAHLWLAQWLPLARLGDGAAERMPQRIEVAFVRELAPAAPPPAPVVVRRAAAPKPKAAAPPAAASAPAATTPPEAQQATSAPEAEAVAAEAVAAEAVAAEAERAAAAQALPASAAEPQQAETTVADAVQAEAAQPAASAASAAAAFEWPLSTRLSYTLNGNYRGEVAGAAQVEWLRVGQRYQVHLDVWIGAQVAPLVGRRMSSDGELSEQGLRPRRYDEETRALFRELRRRTIVFDGDRVLLPNGKQWPRIEGMQDAASQFVQLTWLFTTQPQRLQVGQRIEVPLALPTNVDRWAYDVVEQVTLELPVGPLQTFHLRPRRELRPNRDLVADVWFAPSLQYLPVRLLIRQDESTYVDLLLDRLPQQEAPPPAHAASAPR